jgi:hypothetical protein
MCEAFNNGVIFVDEKYFGNTFFLRKFLELKKKIINF